jgi:competence CoiA-like predicted nuclease
MKDNKESFKHYTAKNILAEWLSQDYLRVDIESPFCMEGIVLFIPDISCYNVYGRLSIRVD